MNRKLNSEVKIKLIIMIESLKVHFEDQINDELKNGFKTGSLVGDSPKKIFRLACAMEIIEKKEYDILCFLVDRRNEAAHNKPVKLNYDDFPNLDTLLSKEVSDELEVRNDTYWGHYIAILEAVENYFYQKVT